MQPHIAAMMTALAPVTTETEAESALSRVRAAIESDDGLLGSLWSANTKTHLAGQLFVNDIELGRAERSLDRAPPPTFLNLDFTEAIEFFVSRDLVSPEDFDALLDAERFRAFTMRRAIADAIIERAFGRIREAMKGDGTGLRDFITELTDVTRGEGYPGGVRRYLEMVYRTATGTSYNAGRFEQQRRATEGNDSIVYEYVTAGDNRVRASHAALDGKQWRHGDPELSRVYPPNSYNCRCVCIVTEAIDGAALSRPIDAEGAITRGFSGAPGEAIEDEAARA
jgi:SPP1 gp7 family putative phage head morphogenesis protein